MARTGAVKKCNAACHPGLAVCGRVWQKKVNAGFYTSGRQYRTLGGMFREGGIDCSRLGGMTGVWVWAYTFQAQGNRAPWA
ncbi:hypothetical protein MKJ04_03495 [Pontibacter sp. E15-1]|uniref:hypothetical protein n=1 Tax=Pontibacter sp. E15-1 TaxID=2919918 RepID=UPI001F4F2BD9|nr:hypothetical protein [Pontibacter sp. E15-1]MCJ8163891.1 hypothetical protein [Pontibacter sp. E15-1]